MRSVLTANYRCKSQHHFVVGEYLIRITGPSTVSHYIVDEIISEKKVRVRALLSDGSLALTSEAVSGSALESFVKNRVANFLAAARPLVRHAKTG